MAPLFVALPVSTGAAKQMVALIGCFDFDFDFDEA
jgi:hypothetical protein